jgi:hypothetical protein
LNIKNKLEKLFNSNRKGITIHNKKTKLIKKNIYFSKKLMRINTMILSIKKFENILYDPGGTEFYLY